MRPLADLATDLPHADLAGAAILINKFGYYGAARIIGNDIRHTDNFVLAGRLTLEHLYEVAPANLKKYLEVFDHVLHADTKAFLMQHHDTFQRLFDDNRNRNQQHDWFSANSILATYGMKLDYQGSVVENVDQMWLRVATQFHMPDVDKVLETYHELSHGYYTPASPTIFNAGTVKPQMASCFLLAVDDDMEHIYETLKRMASISKGSGGLGIDISRIRHSEIGADGMSRGILPMLRVYNDTIRYVDQRGKRNGAVTMFLRPFHLDIETFIDLPRKVGDFDERARDLNLCIWTCHLFWQRIKDNGPWTLFCPKRAPQLNELWGEALTTAYLAAEADTTMKPHHRKTIRARELFEQILQVQRDAGMPFIMDGDACNQKSNHRHMGYLRSSNLCLEIIEHTTEDQIAVCNLHSISLSQYVVNGKVDYGQLAVMSRKVVSNLNNMLDRGWYPFMVPAQPAVDAAPATASTNEVIARPALAADPGIIAGTNKRQRPLGIGVAGFADMLNQLDLPFEDPRVDTVNTQVFACIYFNCLLQSVQHAVVDGPCICHAGSPMSEGKLQFDLWAEEFATLGPNKNRPDGRWDVPVEPSAWGQMAVTLMKDGVVHDTVLPTWTDLKRVIVKYGVRNSLLTALMPTASTAQLRRNCESVEAHQSNFYSRMVLSATYPVVNRFMVTDLAALGLWNDYTVEYLKLYRGSLKKFGEYVSQYPAHYPEYTGDKARLQLVQSKYKTMWELPQRRMIDLAAQRGRYLDQSASMSLYFEECTNSRQISALTYGHDLGLKTLMYYLRQPGAKTLDFTVSTDLMEMMLKEKAGVVVAGEVCTKDNPECLSCQ